ncbi:MAG TPA: MMPL family transporter [Candidatus Limnocylindrales bacterium]|nr:MMPL family transporter [Candidatus Limnocylindrales bacterium]
MAILYRPAHRSREVGPLFSRWGAFVYRFRRPVALVALLVALGSTTLASRAIGELSQGGWLDPSSESARVADRLAADFGAGRTSLLALFRRADGADARSPAFQAVIEQTLRPLRDDPRVAEITGYAETGDDRFISTRGDAAYVLIRLALSDEESVAEVPSIRDLLRPPPGTTVQLTGYGPLQLDSNHQSEEDLRRAEVVSLPLAAIVLVLVFASLVAAALPLLVAGLAIPVTLALVFLAAQQVEMSIYVQNIATMLGLALAIDYSLFLVSRFREELGRGRTVGEAVERTVATSGKAVAFSGIAVAVGLSGLLFFPAPAMRSIGIAGALVVLSTLFFALTFLPAVLGMLGPRVSALSLAGLVRRIRGRSPVGPSGAAHPARRVGPGPWERIAAAVMARPVPVLGAVLVFLLATGTPFLHLRQGVPDAAALPPGLESRDAFVALQREFPSGETTPIVVLADVAGDPTSPENALVLARLAERIEAVPGVDRVDSPFSLRDPATGRRLSPDEVAAVYALPPESRPPALQGLLARSVAGSTVRLDAISPYPPASPEGMAVVPAVRTVERGSGIVRLEVGGGAALGHDFLASQAARMPLAVGWTLLVSAVALFLLFGSVVIPLKAVVMTLLSISASFGALVWIFQDGNLHELLAFEPLGYTIAGNPIIMFSTIFGLSMDYEVLLLSRIQEAYRRTGDNRASVAEGLARTAAVITGAASIMISVFAAFALAETITIKSLGVGMAIAVLIDATIVRVLLVPATMRLMGEWNWWAPGFLGRLADRLGFSHVEDEEDERVERVPAPEIA